MSRDHHQGSLRDKGYIQRFGIAEHLTEGFSASCTEVCSRPNADPALAAACDTGSQAYCASDKVGSAECGPYVDRLIRTRAAEKTSAQYSEAVRIPAAAKLTITQYYNALGDAATAYISSNMTNLSAPAVTTLMNIIQAEGGDLSMFNKVADRAISSCIDSPSPDCASIPWIKSRVDKTIADQVALLSASSAQDIMTYITTNLKHFLKFEVQYAPMRNLLMSKITIADITNPALTVLREKSSTIRLAVDLKIVNFVCDTTLTALPLNADGSYAIDLSVKPKLYTSNILLLYYQLESRKVNTALSTDNLAVAIRNANKANVDRCSTVDPMVDPTCVAFRKAGDTSWNADLDMALAKFCANPANVTGDTCVTYIKAITDKAKRDAALSIAYSAALKADGKLDATILNKYGQPMKDWLKAKTADIVTKDANNNTIITPSCGTANSLPVDQCKQICEIYPDVCLDDQIQQASLPQYRYAKETFNGGSLGQYTICSSDGDELSAQILLYMVLLAIAVAFAIIFIQKRRRMGAIRSARLEQKQTTMEKPEE